MAINLKTHIRGVPDFPKPGILFYDISTLLAHPQAWQETLNRTANLLRDYNPDIIAGIESRGFLIASPLAIMLNASLMMVRKKGKLPGKTIPYSYDLEYGSDTIEIQDEVIKPGQRVVVLDDLLATGGTLNAAIALLQKAQADVVAAACVVELNFLKGREKLTVPFHSLVQYSE